MSNLKLLMEYMEKNQYFIGNDLLEKYNELLKKEKQEQLDLYGGFSNKNELLMAFSLYVVNEPTKSIDDLFIDFDKEYKSR